MRNLSCQGWTGSKSNMWMRCPFEYGPPKVIVYKHLSERKNRILRRVWGTGSRVCSYSIYKQAFLRPGPCRPFISWSKPTSGRLSGFPIGAMANRQDTWDGMLPSWSALTLLQGRRHLPTRPWSFGLPSCPTSSLLLLASKQPSLIVVSFVVPSLVSGQRR